MTKVIAENLESILGGRNGLWEPHLSVIGVL